MQSVALDQRPLDSFHALCVEPFLKLLSTPTPTFDPGTKAFTYRYSATQVVSDLMLSGRSELAVSLREAKALDVILGYGGNRITMIVQLDADSGSPLKVSPASLAPGLDVALVELYKSPIQSALQRAERYLSGMSKLVYRSSELLINATRGGITFRVRIDVPRIDEHLVDALDRAMSIGAGQIICLRVTRIDPDGQKTESLQQAQVVSRHQPLRPLAVNALSSFIQSTQDSPAISMR